MQATIRRSPSKQPTSWPVDVRLLHSAARALFAVAAILGAAMLLMWLVRQPVFNVGSIVIEGDVARTNEPTIRANALPLIRGNYFTLNLAQTQRAFEAVPWVRSASLLRIWPNRLHVQLEEHRPVALWAMEQESDQLVNSYGEVFQANLGDIEDIDLPVLQGPVGSSLQVLTTYLRLQPLFTPLQLQLDSLTLSPRGSWQAEFDTGLEIELGRGSADELAERAQRFVTTVPQITAKYERALQFADLRHHEGYAVKLKGVTTEQSAPPKTTKPTKPTPPPRP
jgi:cell division protein FtsQ